jgi:hypothetical protein
MGKKISIDNSLSVKDFGSVINNLPKEKAPGLQGFTGQLSHMFKKEVQVTILQIILQDINRENTS